MFDTKSTFDYSVEDGFAWIIIKDWNGNDHTFQVCVESDDTGEYTGIINPSDCGHDWGICGDINPATEDKFGAGWCMIRLLESAKQHGFKILKNNYIQ